MKRASIRRQMLVVLLDFALYSALCQVLVFTVPYWLMRGHIRLFFFIAVEMVLLYRGISPSCFLMSIVGEPGETKHSYVLKVEEEISSHEHPLTMLIGAAYVFAGAHFLVRWTQWVPPMPLFGVVLREPASWAVDIQLGFFFVYLGVAWLRLKRRAFWLSLIFGLVSIVSIYMSTDLWIDYMRSWLIQQRQFFSMSYDEVSIVLVKNIMPEFAYLVASVQVAAALLLRKRLLR